MYIHVQHISDLGDGDKYMTLLSRMNFYRYISCKHLAGHVTMYVQCSTLFRLNANNF